MRESGSGSSSSESDRFMGLGAAGSQAVKASTQGKLQETRMLQAFPFQGVILESPMQLLGNTNIVKEEVGAEGENFIVP